MKLILLFLALAVVVVSGQTVKSDLEAAQKRLVAQREGFQQSQAESSERLTALQEELLLKRRQADIARRSITDQRAYASTVENQALRSSTEAKNLSGSLRTYGLQHHARQLPGTPAEPRLDPIFTEEKEGQTALVERLQVIGVGLDRIESAIGGEVLSAEASKEDAEVIKGKVAAFGPARWFVSDDGSTAGAYLLAKSGQVATVDTDSAKEAQALLSGGEAQVQIDITGGKARALAEIRNTPLELIKKGGAWVYPILLIALVSLLCAIYKGIKLLGLKDLKDDWINEVGEKITSGNQAEAAEYARRVNHPAQAVIPNMVEAVSDKLNVAEEVLYERLMPVRQNLRGLLGLISVTAAVAPLLGLLGTVSGLIKTFSVIAVEGTGEAQSISGGISEALITTLFGLVVAIPSFMLHAVLIRKAKGVEQNIERVGLAILNHVRRHQA